MTLIIYIIVLCFFLNYLKLNVKSLETIRSTDVRSDNTKLSKRWADRRYCSILFFTRLQPHGLLGPTVLNDAPQIGDSLSC